MPDTLMAKKLGMKPGMRIAIVNPPGEYLRRLGSIPSVTATPANDDRKFDFIHVFVRNSHDLRRFCHSALNTIADNGSLWFSYPKKSGAIGTDITRDTGWDVLTRNGYRPVTAVSIDEDWSALRFKPAAMVKSETVQSRYVDTAKKKVTLPKYLASAFRMSINARKYFDSLAYTHRKEYVLWIESAKKPETRKDRITKTLVKLLGKTGKS
jgi:hypothetical protein